MAKTSYLCRIKVEIFTIYNFYLVFSFISPHTPELDISSDQIAAYQTALNFDLI